jgi:phage tail-like protein
MSMTAEQMSASYPLPVYNYKVEIDGQTVGFSEVSGLSIAYETIRYAESASGGGKPGPRWMHMPAQANAPTITLKKGIVPSLSVETFFNWIKTIQGSRVEKRDICVRLCDEQGQAVISWRILNAFPTKLEAPSFSASGNEVAVESMELMADGVTIDAA